MTSDRGPWTLSNRHMEIHLSPETNGGLAAFVDLKTGRNFIHPSPAPLYRLTLSQPGRDPIELSSLDAESLEVRRASSPIAEVLALTYGRHRALDITVSCHVLLEEDSSLSDWRFFIRNNTSYGVRTIRYPVVIAPAVLGESDQDDHFLWGNPWQTLIHRPGRHARKRLERIKRESAEDERAARFDYCPNQYPGLLGVQLQAYYDGTAGLYMATYDSGGNIKGFGYAMADIGEALDLSIQHHYDERPGLTFALPYETILGVFHGDWYTAADIYKEWAHQQEWCSKKTVERTDIPDWLKEPRPWLQIISQCNVERSRGIIWSLPEDFPLGKFWPARKLPPLMKKYSSAFGTPVVPWLEGWEKIGSPGGPVDIFPPLEGEESFKAATAELRRDGNHLLLYAVGFQWCFKKPGAGYDGRERFQREGLKCAALNDRGEVDKFVFPNAQKHFVNLCVGSKDAQQLIEHNLLYLMDLGADAVHIDQQHGMYAAVCYSDQHGHPPGYGPWMYQGVLEFLRRVRQEIKRRNPEATLSFETPCEIWIQEVDHQLHRPYMLGAVPLFDYIYHEYAPCHGGDDKLGVHHPEASLMKHAICCVYGLQNEVSIGEAQYDIEVEEIEHPVIPFLKNIFQAQRTFARDYLVFGQMLRPTALQVPSMTVDVWIPISERIVLETVEMPLIIHGVWKSPQGKIGYVLINWTKDPQEGILELVKTGGKASIVMATAREPVPEEKLRSGKLEVTVAPRDVMLIEQE